MRPDPSLARGCLAGLDRFGLGALIGLLGAANIAVAPSATRPSATRIAGFFEAAVFVANYGGTGATGIEATGSVTRYSPGGTGDLRALQTISSKVNAPQGLAFDSSGDLWVANSNTNTLLKYGKGQLAKTSPVPTVTISSSASGSLNGPGGLAFDSSGDLWVANTGVSTVVEYGKSELANIRLAKPEDDNFQLHVQRALWHRLRLRGDLWVSDNAQPGTPAVFEYARSKLTERSPAPERALAMPTSPLGDLTRSGLAFDASGDLWVDNSGGNSLIEFSRSALARPSPRPSVTISSDAVREPKTPADDLAFRILGRHVGGRYGRQ